MNLKFKTLFIYSTRSKIIILDIRYYYFNYNFNNIGYEMGIEYKYSKINFAMNYKL